jgi:hypothetical protein
MKTKKLNLDSLTVNSFVTGTDHVIGGRALDFASPSQGAKVCSKDSCVVLGEA